MVQVGVGIAIAYNLPVVGEYIRPIVSSAVDLGRFLWNHKVEVAIAAILLSVKKLRRLTFDVIRLAIELVIRLLSIPMILLERCIRA